MKKVILYFLLSITLGEVLHCQTLMQTIRGRIVDIDSKTPLVGAAVFIEGSDPLIAAITDSDGYFQLPEIPVGRYSIGVSSIGYENKSIPNQLLGAGKELVMDIELSESLEQIEEVVITARKNKGEPLNDMSTVSARSISVEETQRFAGSFNDPSRLVSSYAGVMGDPDGNNDIIIRGNSPRGLEWRLEGVDVPNPNHFANEGSTGGPISILNNTTLDDCDFFSGAFPAEYGDAYSGVFDVHLRKGNNKEREFTAQVGVIGMDVTAEGPFFNNSLSSYLINYRYSSLDLLTRLGIKVVGDAIPKFQDMTFNVNIPTSTYGTLQIFGVGGLSKISFDEERSKSDYAADMGVLGVNYILPFSEKTFLKTSFSVTGTINDWEYYESNIEPVTWELMGQEGLAYLTYSLGLHLTHKYSAKNTIKYGITGKLQRYDLQMDLYDYKNEVLYTSLEDDGIAGILQSYINWKYRPVSRLTFNTGVHYKYLDLNGNFSIEPRIGVRWQVTPRQHLTAAFGMHSKTDNISIYLFRERLDDGSVIQQNRDLDFLRAYHYVLGYENQLAPNLNLKLEAYYQDLYNVPVSDEEGSIFSILNESNGYITTKMVNEGTGRNYGLELAVDKFFADNYYFLLTSSLFQSKYTAIDNTERNTKFNNNYIVNIVGGKEFLLGSRKNSAICLNVRGTYAGGQWYTPINIEESRAQGYTVWDNDQAFSKRRPDYIRFDLKVSYRRNKKETTRIWEIDIQNVTNSLNVTGEYWDSQKQEVVTYTQLGILPVLNYRIEF